MDFCNNCGARLIPGADHCPACGASCVPPVPPAQQPDGNIPQSAPQPAGPVYAQAPQPVPPAPPQPQVQAPQGPRYCAGPADHAGTPSVWWYFGMLLLFAVPVVGLVAMLCFSFLPGCTPQQRNLARASLLLALVLAAVVAIGIFLFTLLLGSVQQMMFYSYYGLY